MNLGDSAVVLRYRGALEVLDLALLFVRRKKPELIMALVALVVLPTTIILLGLHHLLEVSWLAIWPMAVVASWLLELPFTTLSGGLLFSPALGLKTTLTASARVLLPYVASQFVFALALIASAIVVIGPVFVAGTFCFSPEVVVLEKAGPLQALRRARRFVKARPGVELETVVLRFLLQVSFLLFGELLGQTASSFVLDITTPTETLFEDGGSPFALFAFLCSTPYTATFRFLAYANERTRQDGWDVQVAFLSLAQSATAESESK